MYTRKSCCWSLLICCIITGFHLQDSPYLFIYWEKVFSVSHQQTNPSILVIFQYPFETGGEEHQFSNWWRRGGKLRWQRQDSARCTGSPFPHLNGTSFRSQRLQQKQSSQQYSSAHHIFPTNSFLKVWTRNKHHGHNSRRVPLLLFLFLGQQLNSSLGPYYPEAKYLFFFFFLRHSWRKMTMVLKSEVSLSLCIWREGGIGRHNYWMILRKYFYPSTEFSFSQQNWG